MATLHILVADPDSNAALMATHILMSNGHNVETCQDGIRALQAIQIRHKEKKPYHIIICSYALPGMDALRLMSELHMTGLKPAIVLLTQAGQLTPSMRTEALKLGCKTFFDYPIPLTELNDFVNQTAVRTVSHDTGPYFGSSKFSHTTSQEISGQHKITPTSNTDQRVKSDQLKPGSYKRQSTGTFHVGAPNTGRVRRSTTGAFTPENTDTHNQAPTVNTTRQQPQPLPPIDINNPPPQRQHPPHTTARIRRSTTGSFTPEQSQQQAAATPQAQPVTYQVACAHCQHIFLVQAHSQEYNAACANCNGLNRIVPQS